MTNKVRLIVRENRMAVQCPNFSLFREMTRFLTFHRKVAERRNGRLFYYQVEEPCYRRLSGDPFSLSCSKGFKNSLLKQFNGNYDFEVIRLKSERDSSVFEPVWENVQDVQFRPQQKEILESLLTAEQGRILVPPGVGKSFLMCQYARLLPHAKIIISTFSLAVLLQIYTDLKRMLGPYQTGICCSRIKTNLRARVICVSQKTLPRFFAPDQKQFADVVFIDEMHEWGSAKNLTVLENIQSARLFGLSANSVRPDQAEFRLNGLFGPVLYRMSDEQAVSWGLITPTLIIWVPVSSDRNPVETIRDPVIRERYGIYRYDCRNKIIAQTARLMDDDDQVLISVKTIDHALHLKQHLPEYTVVYAANQNMRKFHAMGLTKGVPPMTKERLAKLQSLFKAGRLKKVIATGVWLRGMNFPELSVLIRADAANSCIFDTQWIGRTDRIHEGKKISLIFDFTDEFDPVFHKKAMERRQRYRKEHAWTQTSLKEFYESG
jgi:superfamily II DNA or RNA helicase